MAKEEEEKEGSLYCTYSAFAVIKYCISYIIVASFPGHAE